MSSPQVDGGGILILKISNHWREEVIHDIGLGRGARWGRTDQVEQLYQIYEFGSNMPIPYSQFVLASLVLQLVFLEATLH